MNKKPTYLTGEVKEFIDLQITLGARHSSWADDVEMTSDIREDNREFYSQQFQPEMITEYFEGWEYDFFYQRKCYKEVITFIHNSGVMFINGNQFAVSPKTLSQFITNCIQAGIKLQWITNK